MSNFCIWMQSEESSSQMINFEKESFHDLLWQFDIKTYLRIQESQMGFHGVFMDQKSKLNKLETHKV